MAKLMVHGGDFAKGDGWFYPGGRFVLRDKNGWPESILLARVEAADHASEVSLALFGGGESLRADFECAMSEGKTRERMFIACFDDGRLLLASTDRTSFEEICASRFTRLTNAFSKKLKNLQAAGGSSMPHGDVATPLFPDRTRSR
jgi:hypothetical protein